MYRISIVLVLIWVLFQIIAYDSGNMALEERSHQHNKGLQVTEKDTITIFMSGDVMLGRGIDQVLPHPSDPKIYEGYMKDARGYVEIAERKNGPIHSPVSYSYVWGKALDEFEKLKPDLKIINLETSVTNSDDYWKGKGINYRMNPENIQCLNAAEIDFCSLANNHVLDWGYTGLLETIKTLNEAKVIFAGAGHRITDAEAPAVFEIEEKGRVLVFSYAHPSSGTPKKWIAGNDKPGLNVLNDLSYSSLISVKDNISKYSKKDDIVIVSIHWGGNWGYSVPVEHIEFAHWLIDEAEVDVVHGHSSHHVKGMEVYKDRLIIYGCGDFISDYEGISGYEDFRDDLGLMYFVSLEPKTGKLLQLKMTPTLLKNFRLNEPSKTDVKWLQNVLNREGRKFGNKVKLDEDGRFVLNPVRN